MLALTPYDVVFGEVLSGMELIQEIEATGTAEGRPTAQVLIEDCGELPL